MLEDDDGMREEDDIPFFCFLRISEGEASGNDLGLYRPSSACDDSTLGFVGYSGGGRAIVRVFDKVVLGCFVAATDIMIIMIIIIAAVGEVNVVIIIIVAVGEVDECDYYC
jgi:hypothetical protein